MKKLALIYNPFSGDNSFKYDLDPCINEFQKGGYQAHVFRITSPKDMESYICSIAPKNYDALVIAGGDGSINMAINAMMENGLKCPLGIIPSGTANDFASFIKLPKEPSLAAAIIAKGNKLRCDLGVANGKYFINVCAAGMFTNISQNIDTNFKNTFGKLAYYIKGIEQIPNFVPIKVRITNSTNTYNEKIFFFLALNSSGTGGFDKLSIGAAIDDGLFDFIAFKAFPIIDLPILFIKVLSGDYLSDSRILFFRDSYVNVEVLETPKNLVLLETDVDGEAGPNLPIEIRNINKAIDIFIP